MSGGPSPFNGNFKCAREGCTRGTYGSGVKTGSAAKLTAEQCVEVKKMSSQFKAPAEIAKRFGVSVVTVRAVLNGTYAPKRGPK